MKTEKMTRIALTVVVVLGLCGSTLIADVNEGLISHWRFDEGNGTTAYDSAGTNDGTIYGAAWTTGIIDGALDFDGVDDYVEADIGTTDGNISYSFWFKSNDISVEKRIVTRDWTNGGSFTTGHINNRIQAIFTHSNGVRGVSVNSGTISSDTWYHTVCVFDSTNVALYVNGEIKDTTSQTSILLDSRHLWIGARNYNFNGIIDEVAIYDRALSAGEIEELYNSVPPPPVGETYHVDGATGDNTNDGLSRGTAFATIQRGINAAEDYDTVLVWPGVYNEEIGFWGDAITVKSAADAAVVETDYGYAFSFFSAEGPDTVLSNFVIRNSQYGIYLVNGSSPTLRNLTIVNNDFGISAYNGSDPDISNCIFWSNKYGDLFRDPVPLEAKYSWIQEEIEDGLVAYWKLDEGSGSIAHDDSGNGHDGSINGATWVDGVSGKALSFDGSGDYVGLPSSSNLSFNSPSEAFSTSFWIKPDTIPPVVQTILENEDDYLVSLHGEILRYRKTDSGNLYHNVWESTNPGISAENWFHIAITYDGTGAGGTKMYVNGEEKTVTTTSYHGGGSASGDNFAIGIRPSDFASTPYGGEIDEVRIYDRALSAEEIEEMYEAGLACLSYGGPGFVDANGGDYHLLSERGRYWPAHDVWVLDDVTSPCIDGGDPAVDPSDEPMPNGGRINMGAYGNTAYASMSEWPIKGDINNDGRFNFLDIAILLDEWLTELPWAQ